MAAVAADGRRVPGCRKGVPVMGEHETLMVPIADGRKVEVVLEGRPDGFPLVFSCWTPGAAVPFGALHRAAADRGLTLVSYSRAGYGLSTPRKDADTTATMAADAIDIATVLDHLGLGEFVTLGWSGGGPRAFACAALLPERCRAAASLASLVPPDPEGFVPYAGMTEANRREFEATSRGAEEVAAHLEEFVAPMIGASDAQLAEALRMMFGPSVSGELADYAVACMRHSVHQGLVGWRDDNYSQIHPWGFELSGIRVPMSIWHGTEDANVAPGHAVWLSEHVPGARLHLVDGADHISIILAVDDILDELLELAGRPLASSR
jgi:pimeloyl-ACP methyl ester carboxylesterase